MAAVTGGAPFTIFVIDDDASVRDSLCWLLESESYRTRSFSSAIDFLEEFSDDLYGCIALDVRMPGMSGLELQDTLRRRGNRLPIIIITGHADVPMAIRAMKAGAFDFIEKPYSDDLVLESVRRAQTAAGRDREVRGEREAARARYESLSEREQQVLERVAAGQSNKRIAADLGLALKTVESHRSRIMVKMKAGSLSDLVRAVMILQQQSET